MEFLDINNVLFSIANRPVSLVEFLSVIFGLTTVFLAGRGNKNNYWFGYIYTILLFILFMQNSLYSNMLLQPISFGIAIYGHYQWTHPRKGNENKKNELKISILNNHKRILSVVLIMLFSVIWGTFMLWASGLWPDLFSPAKLPFLDAAVVGCIFTAQYLSAKKYIDCWGAWLLVNITNIILYISAGLIFMPLVSAAYLILAFFGFALWKNQMKEQTL
ncbi:MAG: nicotinamide riboside transporter PnuC [Bacteroidales bacterium]